MLTSAELRPAVVQALGRVLAHLGAGGEGEARGLDDQIRDFKRIKQERGRGPVADSLGLTEAELPLFDAALRDVERTDDRLADGGKPAERNALLASLRLLSWLEAIGQQNPALALEAEVEAGVSEDLGRKQVRAVELIVRSLITESYGDQETLLVHLREALNERVVEKWQGSADEGDILSGLTFSELSCLFVNKKEFERYEKLYGDTPFLTLLKQRRRTIQSFLDDMRRIRNVMAHNKRVTPIQLSLLDLYYEEVVSPVQTAFDQGDTRIDPDLHLDASEEEMEKYVAGLHEDVEAVRDDLADLKDSVMTSLGGLEASTARIEETTTGVNRKLLYAGAALLALLGLTIFLISQGDDTQETVEETQETAKVIQETVKETHEAVKETQETAKETQATVEDLKQSHETLTETTKEVAKEVAKSSETIVQSLEELRQGFAALTQTGGIISEPRTPQEHYHNARMYEQRGDYARALTSYRAFFAFEELEFVDPHLRFQSFLKLQRGVAGAREVYYELKQDSQNLAIEFAWNLLLDAQARAAGLNAFLKTHPDFAPAIYARSRDFSVARLGSQTTGDKRSEKKLLQRFLALKEDGTFLRYYLDQGEAARQVRDAEERLAALSSLSEAVLENPVQLSAMHSSTGWTVHLTIRDRVKEILVRVGSEGEFKSTGFLPGALSRDGLPRPDPSLSLRKGVQKTAIHVKYRDVRDQEHGPYELLFDPAVLQLQNAKHILGMLKNSWLLFRDMGPDKTLLYFTGLLSYRAALQEIRYGLDVETPDTVHPFTPAGGGKSLSDSPLEELYISVPGTTKYATVQLTFLDGSKSEVVRFDR